VILPTDRAAAIAAGVGFLGVVAPGPAVPALFAAWALACAADALIARRMPTVTARRQLPPSAVVGGSVAVSLDLSAADGQPVRGWVRDATPAPHLSAAPFVAIGVGLGAAAYTAAVRVRGPARFGPLTLRRPGPLGLVERQDRLWPAGDEVLCLPAGSRPSRYLPLPGREGDRPRRVPPPVAGTAFYELGHDPRAPGARLSARASARLGRPVAALFRPDAGQRLHLVVDAGVAASAPDPDRPDRPLLDHLVDAASALAVMALQEGLVLHLSLTGGARPVALEAAGMRGRGAVLRALAAAESGEGPFPAPAPRVPGALVVALTAAAPDAVPPARLARSLPRGSVVGYLAERRRLAAPRPLRDLDDLALAGADARIDLDRRAALRALRAAGFEALEGTGPALAAAVWRALPHRLEAVR
jgi:uncharacterized protein (DUF58 family)